MENNSFVKTNSFKAWVFAARPKTLTGALIPVMLGASLAYKYGYFEWQLVVLCALFACCMQIAANFVNDLYDFLKGADREDRLGPERACAQGWISPGKMRYGIFWTIVFACLCGLTALALTWYKLPYSGVEFIIVGVACIFFAILYTTTFSYQGLGDVLVLVFFGLIPVCGTYYIQVKSIDTNTLLLSLVSGVAIDTLLIINNYRDRVQDTLSGKRTLVVIYGDRFGRNLYFSVCVIVDILLFVLFSRDVISFIGFVLSGGIYTALHIRTWLKMVEIGSGKRLNTILGQTSRNMFILGLLLSMTLVFS